MKCVINVNVARYKQRKDGSIHMMYSTLNVVLIYTVKQASY